MNTQFSTYTVNNILPKVAYNALNTNAKTCMANYRYGFNGQEKVNEVYGFGNLNIAEFWRYDTHVWILGENQSANGAVVRDGTEVNITKHKHR